MIPLRSEYHRRTLGGSLPRIAILPTAIATLQRFKRLQWLNPSILKDRQQQKLRQIVTYASTNVPFYQRLFHKNASTQVL